jgi:signal transduction histidine kinase/ActR/RegA family two-component response regulator
MNEPKLFLRANRDVTCLIVRERRPRELLAEACGILVQVGGYSLAWVGLLQPDGLLSPVARVGRRAGSSDPLAGASEESRETDGAAATAIRTGQPCLCQIEQKGPSLVRSRTRAGPSCSEVVAAVPIRIGPRTLGAVTVHSDSVEAFSGEELTFLNDVTEDLAYALESIENEQQRRRAESANERSVAELTAIYDAIPLMMCLVNSDHQVERMNRAMAEFADEVVPQEPGPRPGDLLGCINAFEKPGGCGHGAECATCPLRMAVTRTFETGEPCREVEAGLLLVRKGQRREMRFSASAVRVAWLDRPKVLVCLEDVTARTQLQAQFLQAQKMEAVGQLAGGIAHDFNNILSATLIHLQLLQQKQKLEPEIAASLYELELGAQRATSLTRQLLLFSRRQIVKTRRVDANELVQGLLRMLNRLLGEHIQAVFAPSPLPAWVEADPGMFEQVVMNLCVNARDAMAKGGQLTLSTQIRDVEAKSSDPAGPRSGRFICLAVADTGCGMDKATLQHLFEPFFTTKDPHRGTGLGLATVQGIARLHKGWVEVESALGRGSVFRVFLPAVVAPEPLELQAVRAKAPRGTETILLVEDDEPVRRMVRHALRLFGYEVLQAADGVEALRIWEQDGARVKLMFTDMVMPGGITGLDLAERLRQIRPSLKVVIASGYAAELLQRGVPPGMKFLAKPFDPDTLARTVRECLDQKD